MTVPACRTDRRLEWSLWSKTGAVFVVTNNTTTAVLPVTCTSAESGKEFHLIEYYYMDTIYYHFSRSTRRLESRHIGWNEA
jgi:hypothetical protein